MRLLDHTGRPLGSGAVQITTGGVTHDVMLTPASDGDSGVDVVGGAAHVTAAGAGALLASADSDTGAVGGPLALTDADRHVLVSDTARWLAPRSPGVTADLPRWTIGNTVEPIVDGIPYFARLVPDLRAAKGGGAVELADWDFVNESLHDKTKPWSLLPEDNSTELLKLVDELITGGADVLVLVNRFLQTSEAELETIRWDVGVALVAAVVLLGLVDVVHWLVTDTAGWVLLAAGLTLIPALPNDLLRDAIVALAEPSKDGLEALNNAHPGTAVWTPYPATLADNPLAPRPALDRRRPRRRGREQRRRLPPQDRDHEAACGRPDRLPRRHRHQPEPRRRSAAPGVGPVPRRPGPAHGPGGQRGRPDRRRACGLPRRERPDPARPRSDRAAR